MSSVKKYLKICSYIFILIILLLFIINIFYYFNLISNGFYKAFKINIILLSLFVNSIYLGSISNKKGYLEGIKLGGCFITILFLLNIIFREDVKFRILLYYLILILTSCLGSMIGINIKKKELN